MNKTRNSYVSVSKSKLVIQELVVLAGHDCRDKNCPYGWWHSTKIILVGETAPQNHSCSGNERKHEMQMKQNEGNIVFPFLLDINKEHKNKRRERKKSEGTQLQLGLGARRGGDVHRFYRGEPPLVWPNQVGWPTPPSPHPCPIFAELLLQVSMPSIRSKSDWTPAVLGRCRPRSGAKWTWTWKWSKFMHALDSKC